MGAIKKHSAPRSPGSPAKIIIKVVSAAIPTLAFLLLAGIVLMWALDHIAAESYYTSAIFRLLISGEHITSLLLSFLDSRGKILLWSLGATLVFALIKLAARRRSGGRTRSVPGSILHMLLSTAYFAFLLLCFVNTLLISYVDNRFYSGVVPEFGTMSYFDKIDSIRGEIQNRDLAVTLQLNKVMADIQDNPNWREELEYQDFLRVCMEINDLIDQKEGPSTPEEHYFRNCLNTAPPTLEAMIAEVKSPVNIIWLFMEPKDSTYHMFGADGEYNVKFVSEDGLFEAVYGRDGALLTEENGALNMGTYNYASPMTRHQKHVVYDVLPYELWGNVPFSPSYQERTARSNLEKLRRNPDALQYRAELKSRLEP